MSFSANDSFLVSNEYAKIVVKQNNLFGQGKKYHIANKCPFAFLASPELQRRSPYRRIFDQFLLRCVQAGLTVSR